MNSFLKQFGILKKGKNGLNEYVKYIKKGPERGLFYISINSIWPVLIYNPCTRTISRFYCCT